MNGNMFVSVNHKESYETLVIYLEILAFPAPPPLSGYCNPCPAVLSFDSYDLFCNKCLIESYHCKSF